MNHIQKLAIKLFHLDTYQAIRDAYQKGKAEGQKQEIVYIQHCVNCLGMPKHLSAQHWNPFVPPPTRPPIEMTEPFVRQKHSIAMARLKKAAKLQPMPETLHQVQAFPPIEEYDASRDAWLNADKQAAVQFLAPMPPVADEGDTDDTQRVPVAQQLTYFAKRRLDGQSNL